MKPLKISDEEFLAAWKETPSATEIAKRFNLSVRRASSRRRALENKYGISLISEVEVGSKPRLLIPENEITAELNLLNGTVLVGSDCHYMPDMKSPAHRGFVQVAKKYKPSVICLNGDIFDFASISKHPKLNTRPSIPLKAELEAGQDRCYEIEQASPNSILVRTVGNHDARLDVKLANQTPEMIGLIGIKDWLPRWKACVQLKINDDTMILHKWAQGMHASYNNVLKGLFFNVITGHTHRLNCRPMTSSWRGGETRYGIETGTLADPEHEIFEYTMGANKDWQPGFVMLTFKDGKLMYPEFAHVVDDVLLFRGESFS